MTKWLRLDEKIVDDGKDIDFVEEIWGDVLRELAKDNPANKGTKSKEK